MFLGAHLFPVALSLSVISKARPTQPPHSRWKSKVEPLEAPRLSNVRLDLVRPEKWQACRSVVGRGRAPSLHVCGNEAKPKSPRRVRLSDSAPAAGLPSSTGAHSSYALIQSTIDTPSAVCSFTFTRTDPTACVMLLNA
ncbi:hypothetical protein Zmor_024760 [Zophobas morio]|uniref:Secreted protein n=1 Tax=Zophobas morio TaxID=2755281 RepID=A0AA38I321_9CUCU|nr:hypothetical protein Zmor_024760 [Zophobas morio]